MTQIYPHTYVENRLHRWGYWYHAGKKPGPERVISWWGPMVLDRNVERIADPERRNMIKVDPTEADETDRAVKKLPYHLRSCVHEKWLKRGTDEQRCRKLGISEATFYARLQRAYAELLGYMNDIAAETRYER